MHSIKEDRDRRAAGEVKCPPAPRGLYANASGDLMPASAQTAQMLELAAAQGAPENTDPALFKSYLTHVTPQVRSAFMERHTPEAVFRVLSAVFEAVQVRKNAAPAVHVSSTEASASVITLMPDQPFIVDTLLLGLKTEQMTYVAGFNMVLGVRRDDSGQMIGVDGPGDALESHIFVECEPIEPKICKGRALSLIHISEPTRPY